VIANPAGRRWRVDDLGQRLRRFREDRGWTQAALAEHAGVSKPYLSELEGGAGRRPSGQILLKLADALGVTVADLLGRQIVPAQEPDIPPGLREFARLRGLPESDTRMLAGIRFRGEAPRTPQRWEHIYNAIRTSQVLDDDAS
jgi:transcriptional regulator with XRE-family HTH domain